VFDSWKLHSRRSYAVSERLGELVGTGMASSNSDGTMPAGSTDVERAAVLAYVASKALTIVVLTAGSGPDTDRNVENRIWRRMTPNSGADASILLAHGMATLLRRLADSEPQADVLALLNEHLPWNDESEAQLQRLVASVDPVDASGRDEARMSIAFGAISGIVGESDARELPGFRTPPSPLHYDNFELGLQWQTCWNHIDTLWLRATDPDGLGPEADSYFAQE
jgi:hypothetical protein